MDSETKERSTKITKAIIDLIGHDIFKDKVVADLGCGSCLIGSAFARLNSKVVIAVDARQTTLTNAKKTFPHLRIVQSDLDKEWPLALRSVDITLDIDLLCHLKNWEAHLKNACNSSNVLVLETAVMDSNEENVSSYPENKNDPNLSFNGFASIPTAAYIERILTECGMDFKRHDIAKLNSHNRTYDWKVADTKNCDGKLRRFWTCVRTDKASKSVHQMVGNPQYAMQGMILTPRPPEPIPSPTPLPYIPPPTYPDLPKIDMSGQPRVAVCISGNLRTFERTAMSFKHFILGHFKDRFDTFIYTWDTIGSKAVPYDRPLSGTNTQSKTGEIERYFAPKKLVIDNPRSSQALGATMAIQTGARLSPADFAKFRNSSLLPYAEMLYGWKRSKELMEEYEHEQGFKYDIVIKLRTDLLFKTPFDIRTAMNRICVPNIGQYYQGAMNDQFAVGPADSMRTYLSLIDSLLNYLNTRACEFRPEFLLRHHLKRNSIPYSEENIGYYILRSNGNMETPATVKQR